MGWALLFLALLALALVALWLARRSRASAGIPAGRLISADTSRWLPVDRPLFSRTHGLTGRPDYLVRRGRDVIPVEVKSGRPPAGRPHTSHILQLAAYCLLSAETYGRRPPCGIILYADQPDQAFEIAYTPALERELLSTLERMQHALTAGAAPRDHDQAARCRACSYRQSCDQSLA